MAFRPAKENSQATYLGFGTNKSLYNDAHKPYPKNSKLNMIPKVMPRLCMSYTHSQKCAKITWFWTYRFWWINYDIAPSKSENWNKNKDIDLNYQLLTELLTTKTILHWLQIIQTRLRFIMNNFSQWHLSLPTILYYNQ